MLLMLVLDLDVGLKVIKNNRIKMEKRLDILRKEMLDDEHAYETFKQTCSRELTPEERQDNMKHPTFDSMHVIKSEPRMFELTKENSDEMKNLERNKSYTHKLFVDEYMKTK